MDKSIIIKIILIILLVVAIILGMFYAYFIYKPSPTPSVTTPPTEMPSPFETTPTTGQLPPETAPSPPTGAYLDLSIYEFIQKIFSKNLTDLQREELWKECKGRLVRWTAMVEDISSTDSEIIGYFYVPEPNPHYDLVIVKFDETQKKPLLELRPRDLVTFGGVIEGPKPVLGRNIAVVVEKGKIIETITPVWTKTIEVGYDAYDAVICDDAIYWYFGQVIAMDANTGQIIWASGLGKGEQRLIGLDAKNIYFLSVVLKYESHRRWEQGIVQALDRQSGKISSEFLIYEVEKYPKEEESPTMDEIRAMLVERGVKFIQYSEFGQKATLDNNVDILGKWNCGIDRIGSFDGCVFARDSSSQRVLWVWYLPSPFEPFGSLRFILGAKGNMLYFVYSSFRETEVRAYKVNPW